MINVECRALMLRACGQFFLVFMFPEGPCAQIVYTLALT